MPNKALNRQQKGAGLGLPMATIGFNMTSPNSEDIYSLIGFTLTYIQVVERSISFVTTYVLQDDDPLTLAKLNSIQAKERKKALGYFIGKVKERATLALPLENLLSDYLKNRNDFIHNNDQIPEWDLNTERGRCVAKQFTVNLLRQAHKVNEIFSALISRWQEQTGIYPPEPHGGEEYIRSIDDKYGAVIDILFMSKT
ncbi:hypothetical protein ACSZOL_04580 [Aeromonas hydrophila]|uniref:Apea-like HEPN domain-containing protein n=1 Tax=Aeromonas hydrophila TaxID=644 RepID=A0AAX3PCB0_AERHY|nr:hypothetical protein [Aeromonas hydrophila]MCO4115942.1 hypothetical protein [Aeromonas hydrophila]MCV9384549.1 hypothetical protein [Aeromonas hydrophila]WEE28414.1 hypothetical protein PY771_08865 [Aeromonas hydrophila]HDT5863307.1 hypothetical protein [Aeromonas hydrophila subsp. hydrophila]